MNEYMSKKTEKEGITADTQLLLNISIEFNENN